jgi:hypothetical protein
MRNKTLSLLFLVLFVVLSSLSGCFKEKNRDYGIPDDYVRGEWKLNSYVINGIDSTDHVNSFISGCSYVFSIDENTGTKSIFSNCSKGSFILDSGDKKKKQITIAVSPCNCKTVTDCLCKNNRLRYPFQTDSNLLWHIVSISKTKAVLKTDYNGQTIEATFDITL